VSKGRRNESVGPKQGEVEGGEIILKSLGGLNRELDLISRGKNWKVGAKVIWSRYAGQLVCRGGTDDVLSKTSKVGGKIAAGAITRRIKFRREVPTMLKIYREEGKIVGLNNKISSNRGSHRRNREKRRANFPPTTFILGQTCKKKS